MKKSFRKNFTIIEITLAISILAIGIVSIMGVLPVAMRASKNSVAENSMATVASFMKGYVDYKYKTSSNFTAFTGVYPNAISSFTPAQILGLANEQQFGAIFLYSNESGVSGAYRVELRSGTNNVNTDFSAAVTVWITKLNGKFCVTTDTETTPNGHVFNGASTSLANACTVFVKISTPAEATAANQEHRIFSYDYFPKN